MMRAQIVGMILGLWMMAAPDLLGYEAGARLNDHVLGPIAATAACIAVSEATRSARWINLPIGAWLMLAPFVLGYEPVPLLNSVVVGGSLAATAMIRGTVRHRLGGGWSSLWNRGDPAL